MRDENELERRVLKLVEHALDLEAPGRREYVLLNTVDEPDVRKKALELLSIGDKGGAGIATGGAIADEQMLSMPAEIGAYRIEREIGRGGMGSVYLAHRATDDFDHTVAIKVVRKSATSDRYIQRLRAERQTLARLRHSNIAQLYDGGEMPDGAPYVVMEYVDGVRLDQYLARERVDLSQRLEMFRQICQAVSYAHRNLVIHRDLSPANVLVANDAQVKLIDFGIAHNLEEDEMPLPGSSTPQFTMTRGYAAPERGHGIPSSTVTDIYSLGKILGDLIADKKVPRRADLEAVIAKACADAPESRYRTVDALLEEVDAYRVGQAVAAANGGWAYRLTRFVGRRKIAVGFGAAFVVAAMTTSVVMSILYLRADTAEKQASERFEEVRELAGFIIFDLHDEVAKLDGSTLAREKLTKTALGYLDALSASSDVSDSLHLEIARGYKRLSDVTGNPSSANLGQRALASQLLQKAAAQIQTLGVALADEDVLRTHAEIMFAYAVQEGLSHDDYHQAYAHLLGVRNALGELARIAEPTLADQILEAHTDLMIGFSISRASDRSSEAVAEVQKSLSKYEALAERNSDDGEVLMGLARAHVTLGEALAWHIYFSQEGDSEDTLPHFDRGIVLLRNLLARDDPAREMRNQLIVGLLKKANTTCYMERPYPGQGLNDLAEAMRLTEQWAEADPDNRRPQEHMTHIMIQQTACYTNVGQIDEAIRVGQAAIVRRKAALTENPHNPGFLSDLINTIWVVRSIYTEAGDDAGACLLAQDVDEVVRLYVENQPDPRPFVTHQSEENTAFMAECRKKGLL